MKKGVIGIQLLFFGTAVTCAQTFEFEFTSNSQSGVYADLTGLDPIEDWNTSDNPLDDVKNGILFFELEPSEALVQATLGSGSKLNWTGDGLGDGSNGFDGIGEFVSFSFSRDVRIDQLDFKSFSLSGNPLNTDRVDVFHGENLFIQFAGTSSTEAGVRDLGLSLAAGETVKLEFASGAFFLEGFAVSAVPEPSSLILGVLALGGSLLGIRRRRRRQFP